MAGPIDETGEVQVLRCKARTHAIAHYQRFIRVRCRDRTCPDVQSVRGTGTKVIHVFDLESGAEWTEFEPGNRQEGMTDVSRQ